MKFTFAHNNFNVKNLEESIAFYQEALGLVEHAGFSRKVVSLSLLLWGTAQHRTCWNSLG